jgi:L-alanine-DL-glutamate epimerase-like enolase superfamily enzyme
VKAVPGLLSLGWTTLRSAAAVTKLRITDIRLRNLRATRDVGSIEAAWNPGVQVKFVVGGGSFVEIHTDQGLTGIGPGIEPDLLAAAKAQLIGKDPFDIDEHAGRLRYYVRGLQYRGPEGLDIALWDLIGKACNQPLYKLFGGGSNRITAYASMMKLSTPEERAEMAASLADQGWRAIKLRLHHPTMKEDLRTVELVRKSVAERMTIMVDANQAQSEANWQPGVLWDFRRALETARELEKLDVYWLEEPLPRYAFDQLAELNRQVTISLAGGENNRRELEFVEMLQRGVYDILQPECMAAEGITGLRKIGVLAEAFGRKVVPHHGGGQLGTVAHMHLVASWPHAPYLELLHDPPVADYRHRFAVMKNPPVVDSDGMVAVPDGPGLGVEIDPAMIDANA